ncbi:MAG: hypothetical protein JJU00_14535 [Opitutales bacterium]|nr:hypothetical protein [Opitutales bacterium]
MKRIFRKCLLPALVATVAPALGAQALIAYWDFNDEAVHDPLVNTPLSFAPNAGSQAAMASLDTVLATTASPETYGVRDEGTTVNDIVNDPSVAGNAFSFSRGERSNGATMTVSFDASSINLPVELSFAINRIHANGVSQYQASFSTDGGDNFVDLGGVVDITQGVWEAHTVDFGTALSGAEDARVRLTFDGGDQVWSTDHRTNVDNIALTAIPEPRVYAVLFGLLALGFVVWRRRG